MPYGSPTKYSLLKYYTQVYTPNKFDGEAKMKLERVYVEMNVKLGAIFIFIKCANNSSINI